MFNKMSKVRFISSKKMEYFFSNKTKLDLILCMNTHMRVASCQCEMKSFYFYYINTHTYIKF
jgi:hypothetical protein